MVEGLSGPGHLPAALRQDAAGQVLEGVDAGEGGLEVLHLAASLQRLVPDVGGQPLEAGAQRGAGGLQLLGDVTEHGERLGLNLLRRGGGRPSGPFALGVTGPRARERENGGSTVHLGENLSPGGDVEHRWFRIRAL